MKPLPETLTLTIRVAICLMPSLFAGPTGSWKSKPQQVDDFNDLLPLLSTPLHDVSESQSVPQDWLQHSASSTDSPHLSNPAPAHSHELAHSLNHLKNKVNHSPSASIRTEFEQSHQNYWNRISERSRNSQVSENEPGRQPSTVASASYSLVSTPGFDSNTRSAPIFQNHGHDLSGSIYPSSEDSPHLFRQHEKPFQEHPVNLLGYSPAGYMSYDSQAVGNSQSIASLTSTSYFSKVADLGLQQLQTMQKRNSLAQTTVFMPFPKIEPLIETLPGGDGTYWFWGLSDRPKFCKTAYQPLTNAFLQSLDDFWRSCHVDDRNQPTPKEDLHQHVPVRFVSLEKDQDLKTGESRGYVRMMEGESTVLSKSYMSIYMTSLLRWIWIYHTALLEWFKRKDQNIHQKALFDWLWINFNKPSHGLPVVGLTTRTSFKNNSFGPSQLYFIKYLSNPSGHNVRDSASIYLILEWYKNQDSWGKSTFSDEADFWAVLGNAVPYHLNKLKSTRSKAKWSPYWESKFKTNEAPFKKKKKTH